MESLRPGFFFEKLDHLAGALLNKPRSWGEISQGAGVAPKIPEPLQRAYTNEATPYYMLLPHIRICDLRVFLTIIDLPIASMGLIYLPT